FTLVYGLLDLETNRLRYVSAGHPGVIHVPRGGPGRIIDATGYPIGVVNEPYDEYEIELSPQDRVYLYSDGVPEAMDDDGTPFGRERLLEQLDSSRGQSLHDGLGALLGRISDWRGRHHVHDDVSVLALERSPAPAACGP